MLFYCVKKIENIEKPFNKMFVYFLIIRATKFYYVKQK
jgi:hypothetical protein